MAASPVGTLSAARPSDHADVFERQLLEGLFAFRNGDFSARLPSDIAGIHGKIADTFNDVIAVAERRAEETARICRVVGKEGRLKQRMRVPGTLGGWTDEITELNTLIDDLVWPTLEITRAVGAVGKGDLTQSMSLEIDGRVLQGEFLRSVNLVNKMIEQLSLFTSEVTRVAREVGTEGKLGGQARVKELTGVWKDLTDSVNQMAGNLTAQVRNIAEVTMAVANGDLSKKITVDVRGEILQLKEAINTMVEQLRSFASEVTRVARDVGTEGKLGVQAVVPGVAGTWKDLTDSVNAMGANLTAQVRNIAEVTTAVARGDLSRKITVDVKGEILELKDTINTMVDQLNGFASEVSRVAREVGTEGKLGGQAQVPGVAGTWKDLTDSVNAMGTNLTAQVRNIAQVTTAVARGDLSRKITVDVKGEILELKDTINTMVDQLNSFASEVSRVAREVGTEGKLGGQAQVPGVAGTWKDLTHNVNQMAGHLTAQVRNIAEVATAVARGDLSRKITVDVRGEILELKDTINTMVDQLNGFASEVSRVAREVGTEGKLGGQAVVPGVAGTWKDLTDSVNVMGANLTSQVRGIVRVVTAVATGNLRQKLTVEAKGEVAALAETINNMTDTLATFAEQVTNVAREVGVDGRLGGQANVPGASGTWKDLTGNVNLLAANLTNQVRAIAEVATAVTKGDLTRSIQVEARGEVAELKNNINTMIDNLRGTTERNQEQDWLKTNLAKFSSMLQGQRDLVTVGRTLLSELASLVNAQQGAVYQVHAVDATATPEAPGKQLLRLLAGYALPASQPQTLQLGEGLVGQCAIEQTPVLLVDVPASHTRIRSSLTDAPAASILVLPLIFEGQTKAVIELASLRPFTQMHLTFLEQLTQSIGVVLNTIEATMRTEHLLEQSQQLTIELQTRQTQLQSTNEELASKAQQLAAQNVEVERKNKEVEQARHALEEKAAELALTSKYKSEFLANMSHELRTPLNSILILGQQLAENNARNLTSKQVEFARNIHSAGTDLLTLINDILDLSKIESGTVSVDAQEIRFSSVRDSVSRMFEHLAESKGLSLHIDIDESLPSTFTSDFTRLQQILKNLLSNAFKFTAKGEVRISVRRIGQDGPQDAPLSRMAPLAVAFEVRDTGIGIAPEKQKMIFEAFQQADAGTSRKYGGTGLGLAISRELATLLGGEIRLVSKPGEGSVFTLYLPLVYRGPANVPLVAGHVLAPGFGRPALTVVRSSIHEGAATSQVLLAEGNGLDATLLEQDYASYRAEAGYPGADGDDSMQGFDRDPANAGVLKDRVVLVVDDDARNIFALTTLLENYSINVLSATTGRQAVELVKSTPHLDAVLMDIMMPDMDGYETIREIRSSPAFSDLPILALTAKAMQGDRQKCMEAGASDYIAKPVRSGQLLSLLRVWLCR